MPKGDAGKGRFPAHNLVYVSGIDPTTEACIWTNLPDVLELDEETTAQPGEPYRGKLVVGVAMNVDPDKGDRYRTHISLEGDPGEVSAYSGEATFRKAC
jgi:hypothetical protein